MKDEDLLSDIKERMLKLHFYVNSKELNKLQFLYEEIESGIKAKKQAISFLQNVPLGEYDCDRKKYELIIDLK